VIGREERALIKLVPLNSNSGLVPRHFGYSRVSPMWTEHASQRAFLPGSVR
jgi:hypothetical protein